MYIQNRRDCSKFNGCSPLQIRIGLISLKPAIAYFAYTYRYGQQQKMKKSDYVVLKNLWGTVRFSTWIIKFKNRLLCSHLLTLLCGQFLADFQGKKRQNCYTTFWLLTLRLESLKKRFYSSFFFIELNKNKTKYPKMEKRNWKFKLGIVLIIVSTLIFALLLVLPFIETTDKNKIFITTFIVVMGEIFFWVGSFFVGRQIVDKYKSYINPKKWFSRKKNNEKLWFCSFRQLFSGSTAKKRKKNDFSTWKIFEIHVFIGLTILQLEKRQIMLRNIEFKTINLKIIR